MHKTSFLLPHDPTYYAIRHLKQSDADLILDIGANQGISALSFHKICPNCRIVSFEPNPAHQPNLQTLKSRIECFEFHMVGLSDTSGEFVLFTPYYKNIPLHTFSSFNEENVSISLDNSYSPVIRRQITIRQSLCVVKPLDDFGLALDIVKIDAEGLEQQIVSGGIKSIEKYMPSIIFEACHGKLTDITSLLFGLGYKITSYSPQDDVFSEVNVNETVGNVSGLRNLIAVNENIFKKLPRG
jgi:FkbM family methyltransferase